jgi:lipocalin
MLQHRGTVQREKWEYILGTELNKSTRSKKWPYTTGNAVRSDASSSTYITVNFPVVFLSAGYQNIKLLW